MTSVDWLLGKCQDAIHMQGHSVLSEEGQGLIGARLHEGDKAWIGIAWHLVQVYLMCAELP